MNIPNGIVYYQYWETNIPKINSSVSFGKTWTDTIISKKMRVSSGQQTDSNKESYAFLRVCMEIKILEAL